MKQSRLPPDAIEQIKKLRMEMLKVERALKDAGYSRMPGPTLLTLAAQDFLLYADGDKDALSQWEIATQGAFMLAQGFLEPEEKGN